MSSTRPDKFTFSFADFEKGLMLAGLVAPASEAELREREILDTHEKEVNKKNSELYFKRAVLAAEIASELSEESTFGRVKFQKLVYLCEHAADMALQNRYSKQVAGPFDNKFMHSIELEFKKQKWFTVQKIKEGIFTRSKYIPLIDQNKYKKYYDSYFGRDSARISYIINLFRGVKTDKTEIAATLYACSLELLSSGEAISEKRLLELFYGWSESKVQYSQNMVLTTWKWMKEVQLINLP